MDIYNGGFDPNDERFIKAEAMMREYGGLGENELMAELMRQIAAEKANGSFDPEGLKAAANMLLPMLDAEQAQKLIAIVNAILL